MKRRIAAVLVVFTAATGIFAQTTNNKYQVGLFGTPPNGDWGDTSSVAADGKGSILVLRNAKPQVLVFNREGKLQKSWGDGFFPERHSIDVDQEGFVWITDTKDHMVYKFTMDGQQLLALGTKGVSGDNASTNAFNRPTDVFIAPNGDIFVSDGYGNSRIVHFSKDGKFINIISGKTGSGPGEFKVPHAIVIDSRGRLLVLDWQRNSGVRRYQALDAGVKPRIQVFDQNGKFIEAWDDLDLLRPTGAAIGSDDTLYVGDTDGNAIKIVKNGKVIDVIGGLQARPHNIALDRGTGELYVADTTEPGRIKKITKK